MGETEVAGAQQKKQKNFIFLEDCRLEKSCLCKKCLSIVFDDRLDTIENRKETLK